MPWGSQISGKYKQTVWKGLHRCNEIVHGHPRHINFLQMGHHGRFSERRTATFWKRNIRLVLVQQGPCRETSQRQQRSHSYRPVLHTQVREEGPMDRLFLVRLCEWVQARIGDHRNRNHRCRQPRMHDPGLRPYLTPGPWQYGHELSGLICRLPHQ